MFTYILFFVVNIMCLFVKSDYHINDDYNIRFNLNKIAYFSARYETARIFVLLRDKPFAIKFVNYQASSITCEVNSNWCYMRTFKIVKESGVIHSIITVPNATDDMTGKWTCIIKRDYPTYDLNITFRVRVKSSYVRRVKIEIGGRVVNTRLTNSSELEYDEVATYSYWDGEMLELACSNEQNDGMIYLRYYDKTGETLIKTGELLKGIGYENNNIIFQKKLHATQNNSMIDCTYVRAQDRIEFSYRIIFIQNIERSNGNFQVVINNIQLTSDQNSVAADDMRTSRYHHIFYPDERINIRCQPLKNGELKPSLFSSVTQKLLNENEEGCAYIEFSVELNAGWLENCSAVPNGPRERTDTREIFDNKLRFTTKSGVKCGAFEAGQFEQKAYILLIKRDQPRLRIFGLNAKFVMAEYTNTTKDWVIEYLYSEEQIINISCVASAIGPLQLFESSKIQKYPTMTWKLSQVFRMKDAHIGSTIICREGNTEADYKRQVIIKLNRDSSVKDTGSSRGISYTPSLPIDNAPPHNSSNAIEDSTDEDTKTLDPFVDVPETSPPTDDSKRDSQFNEKKYFIGSAVLLLVLFIIGSLIFYKRYKKYRNKQIDGNRPREFLPAPPVNKEDSNDSDTCDHVYQYIDVDTDGNRPRLSVPRPPAKIVSSSNQHQGLCRHAEAAGKDDYDYAFVAESEVEPSSTPTVKTAPNNTIYYWVHE